EGDLVLGGAAAGEDRDPEARHYGGPGGGGVPEKLPAGVVTKGAGGACPGGSRVWTIPSWPGAVTRCATTFSLKPEAVRFATASAWDRLVTSGTVEVVGPRETVSVIVVPGGWYVPASGLCATTVSFGALLSTSLRLTAKPAPRSAELALSKV